MNNLPDIFITGVMKGGTTILHDYICTHPAIMAGSQKEIHYFSLHYDKGSRWYAEHFSDVPENIRTIDASPTYFDVTNTAQIPRLIRAYTPDPRVIVITRDPIERAISQFIHLKVTTSVEALKDVEINDFFNQDLADAYRQSTGLGFYLNLVLGFSLYSRKLMTYRQEFESHQFKVLDNNALRENPRDVMRGVFDFLNVEYVNNKMFGVVKYSNGSSVEKISLETYQRLADFLYPDYERFCQLAGIQFKKISHHKE
jgi:hypothetical protein